MAKSNQTRSKELLQYINEHGHVSFSDLCEVFSVSPATMRRDLTALAEKGQIHRLHGSVKSIIDDQKYEPTYSERANMNIDDKKKIAKRAFQEIRNGDNIILASSTTVTELARLIAQSSLAITVITNDIEIAFILARNPKIDLICVGGHIRKGYFNSTGFLAENFWQELYADKLFMGVDAISSTHGMMYYHLEGLSCKKLMLGHSNKHYVLCDSSKFSTSAILQGCPTEAVDMLITDSKIPKTNEELLTEAGLHIVKV